ncbi:MAG: hypothetical protein ABSE44_04890 [Candidatus Sulfotelmatobacter sp.]|jgi:hypothetical protein
MKLNQNLFLTALTLAALTAGAWAQTETASNTVPVKNPAAAVPAAAPAPPTVTGADVQALKDALAAQQLQIQQLTQQLQRQAAWQEAQQPAASNPSTAAPAQTTPPQQIAALNSGIGSSTSSSAGEPQQTTTTTVTVLEGPPSTNPMEGPISIHFKGITITPGGFVEAAFVRRSRALGADLPTPFNSLTMPGASQSKVSEFFGSARQSRPTVYVSGRIKNVAFSSYVSADFLSAGVTSSATQTNSYTLRLRQAWGQAKWDNGWSILGGQMWSLLTESKASIAPSDDTGRVNDARPATIDPGYNVGFTFARQYGIRVTKAFGPKVAVAVSMENSEATLTTHGNADNFLVGEAGASNSYNTTSNYSFNPSPDVVAKLAFDPGFGHYEVFGVYDRFRSRVFPCQETVNNGATPPVITTVSPNCPSLADGGTAAAAYNNAKNGGGFGANARWTFADKHVVFGLHGFGGSGIGRYGAAQLADTSVNGNGTLHLVKDLQGLVTLEYHAKKLDLYTYGGSEYAARTASWDPLGKNGDGAAVGYGAPKFSNYGCYTETVPTANSGFAPGSLANCTGDTRAIIEGTAGFWYSVYSGKEGRFRVGAQYSYVTRETWSGVGFTGGGGTSPSGLDNMIYTSFRYYLP